MKLWLVGACVLLLSLPAGKCMCRKGKVTLRIDLAFRRVPWSARHNGLVKPLPKIARMQTLDGVVSLIYVSATLLYQ